MVDILRRGLLAQAGEPEPGGKPLAVPLQGLAVHQHGQPILEAEFGGIRVSSLLLEGAGHAGEAQFAQAV